MITPGIWYARHWTRHAATTVLVDDPTFGVTGRRLIAECESVDDARLMVAGKDLLDITARTVALLTRQRWLPDGPDQESVLLLDARSALVKATCVATAGAP